MFQVREATEDDLPAISRIFATCYGSSYPFPEFREPQGLKKLLYSDDTLMLVAADDDDGGEVVGTASVVLEKGAYSDLVGEFGRLVVLPEYRGRGIGRQLMQARLDRVGDRLHVGLVEARVEHPFSVRISQGHGFAPVGFLPMYNVFGETREHMALLVHYFGNALEMRRNHPRIVPEGYPLACSAMANCGLEPDVVVDEEAPPYPHGDGYELEELTTEGYSALLRIERGRVRKREVFGPLRLHYGFFKLAARHSTYLIARRRGHTAAAVGFTYDDYDRTVRIFELICLDDAAIRFLLSELERRYRDEQRLAAIEIDVRANAPRMQRTLLELGYLPVAYVPALAFHRVERLDVMKMMRLLVEVDQQKVELVPPTSEMAQRVLSTFAHREALPRLGAVVHRLELCRGLSTEQVQRLAGACTLATFEPGERLFGPGEEGTEMYLLLDGAVAVTMGAREQPLAQLAAGSCLGEVALLTGAPHSAAAQATSQVTAGLLGRGELTRLVRLRPDIGVVLYRNLARELSEKLRTADRTLAGD